jgi:hypothetical protein
MSGNDAYRTFPTALRSCGRGCPASACQPWRLLGATSSPGPFFLYPVHVHVDAGRCVTKGSSWGEVR